MKLTKKECLRTGRWIGLWLIVMGLMGLALGWAANAQAVSTTTVQGMVYLANGQAGAGTLDVSWPAFTTANSQAITAGRETVTIGQDGFVSLNLAPNLGATPAGLYYTVVYHMSDGTTSTEYWVVPASAQASVGQVRAQLMPSAQAVQAVSKAYVDQSITELTQSLLTASGGSLSGPLYLNGDPTQALQAADKHYVDSSFGLTVPLAGGNMTGALSDSSGFIGPLTGNVNGNVSGTSSSVTGVVQLGNGGTGAASAAGGLANLGGLSSAGGTLTGALTGPTITATQLGGTYQVDQFPGADFGAKLQACLSTVSAIYGGTCDARNFTGNLSMGSNLNLSTANVTVLLPCATISTASQVLVAAGTRNVALRGCSLRGASAASGSQGGTAFLYSGTGAMVQVGDPTYAADTMGFHMDNAVINTTAASSATAQGLAAYRTQEMDLESLYFLGNANQNGMTLDGTGNYTGGTFFDDAFNGFQTAVNAIGHQTSNTATTDWVNASTFVRLHIDCPTSSGSPISGTYGINLQQGDGNTFTGGDVENCGTALHLGENAQNNTIVGLRNENSTNQVVAEAGSSYNNWMTGGTMFTGQLTDNGTRNSFMDTFHRSFNGMNGDWYGSQQDATVTNHYRIGIGAGNERGLLDRYQTDYGYRWTTGLSDATAGEQFYQVMDELNNVNRLSIGQYNNGQSSTNNQTAINAAGTGAVVLNGSNNSGTGGVIVGSGGASESTVATISNAGNAQFNGTLQVGGPSTFIGTTTVKNQADAEIDQILQAGATANQKESYTYKDYAGSSQWYMVKDANNNWALNSATGGLDSIKAYQSGNSGDTYINTSNSSGVIRLNYESGSSGRTYIYGGSSSSLIAAFSGTTAIAFPGLKSSSGYNCLQIDNSGYLSNTGSACVTNSGNANGTVSTGNAGQIAYYAANGTAISGTSAVPVVAGGTGATTAAGALAAMGAQAAVPGLAGDGKATPGLQVAGAVAAGTTMLFGDGAGPVNVKAMGAKGNGTTDDTSALLAAETKAIALGVPLYLPGGTYLITSGFTLASGENWNFDGGATLLVGSASGLTVFNCGAAGSGHSSINIQNATINASGANQNTYTALSGSCINSHIQIKTYYPNVGMALNFAEENIFDFMVFKASTAGIQFSNASNSNIVSSTNLVGTGVPGSIGLSFDANSSANLFSATEITQWGVGISNSGRANTINGEWLEYNTIGVQALAGSMSLCGGNGGAMTIADGAIVNGGYGCLSPNQPNHRVSALNLAAYYPMNEGAGSALYDWSGNGRDATLSGSYSWSAGPYGSSITLPNSTSGANKISIPASAISYTSPFTVAILDRAGTTYDSAQPITLWMADNSGHNAYFTSTVTGTAARLNFSSGWQRNINNAELMGTGKWRWTFVVFDPVANTTQSIDPSNPDLAPVPNLNAWPLTGTPTSIWIENAGGEHGGYVSVWFGGDLAAGIDDRRGQILD
jgi:hypothetical protein